MNEIKGLCNSCKFAFSGGLAPWDCDGGCLKEDELVKLEDQGQIEDISMIGQEDGERCPLWEEFVQEIAHCEKHSLDHLAEDPCHLCEGEAMRDLDAALEDWNAHRDPERCPHGCLGECDECDVEGDLAYDAARENWHPVYRD